MASVIQGRHHHISGESLLTHLPGRVLVRVVADEEVAALAEDDPVGFGEGRQDPNEGPAGKIQRGPLLPHPQLPDLPHEVAVPALKGLEQPPAGILHEAGRDFPGGLLPYGSKNLDRGIERPMTEEPGPGTRQALRHPGGENIDPRPLPDDAGGKPTQQLVPQGREGLHPAVDGAANGGTADIVGSPRVISMGDDLLLGLDLGELPAEYIF